MTKRLLYVLHQSQTFMSKDTGHRVDLNRLKQSLEPTRAVYIHQTPPNDGGGGYHKVLSSGGWDIVTPSESTAYVSRRLLTRRAAQLELSELFKQLSQDLEGLEGYAEVFIMSDDFGLGPALEFFSQKHPDLWINLILPKGAHEEITNNASVGDIYYFDQAPALAR